MSAITRSSKSDRSDNRGPHKQRGDSDGGMLLLTILIMIFLFQGDPDVWDKLHAYVMHALEIKK